MAKIYIYAPNEEDFRTIGICGALVPSEGTFHEIANGESVVEFEHPYDELMRYTCIAEEFIIKTTVPVRNAPEVQNGHYVSSVAKYTVLSGATKDERSIYNKKKDGKKLKTVPVGAEVTVLKIVADSDRYKVSYTDSKKKTTTGWMSSATHVLKYDRTIDVDQSASGLDQVTPSWELKDQLFRIYSVEKHEDGIRAVARHISYDSMYDIVKLSTTAPSSGSSDYDKMTSSIELSDAIDIMMNSCLTPPEFTLDTVLSGTRAGIFWSGKDPITCILDPDIGVCARWGGQLVRDNNSLYVLYDCGLNRGVVLEYGKNVSGIEYTIDVSNVANCVFPMGRTAKGKPLYLEKSYEYAPTEEDREHFDEIEGDTRGVVYIQNHDGYAYDRIYAFEGSDCTVADDNKEPKTATIRERMLTQAKQTVMNGCEMPEVTIKVNLEIIGDSDEYAQYKGLQKVFLYDYATARYTKDGMKIIDQMVAVSEIDWDILNDRMKEITLGSLANLSSTVSSWQISSNNGGNFAGGNGSSMSYDAVVSAIMAQLNDSGSDMYKRVKAIAGGA